MLKKVTCRFLQEIKNIAEYSGSTAIVDLELLRDI